MLGVKHMWKKQNEGIGAPPPDGSANEVPDLTSLGDSLAQSLTNEQVKKAN